MSIEEKREALSDEDLSDVSGGYVEKGKGWYKWKVFDDKTGKLLGEYHTKKKALEADYNANNEYRKQNLVDRARY